MESGFERPSYLPLLVALVLAGCGGARQGAPESALAGAPDGESKAPTNQPDGALAQKAPRFSWPASFSLPVSERVNKNGNDAEMRYLLRICPAGEGRLRIEHADLRFVSLKGIPADDPQVASAIEQIAPLTAAIPAFVVAPSGAVVDMEGIDEMLAAMARVFPGEKLERMKKAFASEQARELFKEAVYSRWRYWVEAWLAYRPELGPDIEIESDALGTPQKHRLSFEEASRGRARLSLHGEFSKENMQVLVGSVAKAFGAEDSGISEFTDANAVQSARVETDWPEIRPHSVVTEKSITLTFRGEKKSMSERHEYRFDWANVKEATCGTRNP